MGKIFRRWAALQNTGPEKENKFTDLESTNKNKTLEWLKPIIVSGEGLVLWGCSDASDFFHEYTENDYLAAGWWTGVLQAGSRQ